jgi:tryptophan 2,3-dioxygenase
MRIRTAGVQSAPRALVPVGGMQMDKKTTQPDEPVMEPAADPARDELSYEGYLNLEALLGAQRPLADPPNHDEMLFIIQHQVSELWFKLILHELEAAITCLKQDELARSIKILKRIKQVQHQLINQWSVLATLTPSEYVEFRSVLGTASGFQSPQFRILEFRLGNKDRNFLQHFRHNLTYYRRLKTTLESPGFYDEFLRHLYRVGHRIPLACVERDWSEAYVLHPEVVDAFRIIYERTDQYWAAYEVCENLVDMETNFQAWRFHHMKTVERIIGNKKGTAGTAGVRWLRKSLDVYFFPELTEVRTLIGT